MLHLRTLAAVAAAAFVFCATAGAQALEQTPIMTLEIAKKMADACEAKAIAEGWPPVRSTLRSSTKAPISSCSGARKTPFWEVSRFLR